MMLSCEVISDLMVVYGTGEASPETRRLVEEHLAHCPECQSVFQESQAVGVELAETKSMGEPNNGSRFLSRTRRLLFAIAAGTLCLFAGVIVFFERFIMERLAGIPLPHLPGSGGTWFEVMTVSFLLYIGLLIWHRSLQGNRGIFEAVLTILLALTFCATSFTAIYLLSTGTIPLAFAAAFMGVTALIVTFIFLPRVPYMSLVTVVVLLLASGLLVGRAVAGVVSLVDFSLQNPAELGRPAEGIEAADAARVDLSSLGLEWADAREVKQVHGVEIGVAAGAVQAVYRGADREAYLTAIDFGRREEADTFFTQWLNIITVGVQLGELQINPHLSMSNGRILRTYNLGMKRAFNAWQSERWLTIVEVPGPFAQAVPLARRVKEVVARSYRAK